MVDFIMAATVVQTLTMHYTELCERVGEQPDRDLIEAAEKIHGQMLAPPTPEELAGLCEFANDVQRRAGIARSALRN